MIVAKVIEAFALLRANGVEPAVVRMSADTAAEIAREVGYVEVKPVAPGTVEITGEVFDDFLRNNHPHLQGARVLIEAPNGYLPVCPECRAEEIAQRARDFDDLTGGKPEFRSIVDAARTIASHPDAEGRTIKFSRYEDKP